MILGIGIDTVDVARFANWHTRPQEELLRVFSQSEIAYCKSTPALASQRFAVRFAAREALFKALSAGGIHVPLLTLCRAVTIVKSEHGVPSFVIDWGLLPKTGGDSNCEKMNIHLSLSHTETVATAMVVVAT
jgi:holo-[acyl-carrier protein] synthase